MHLYDSSSAKIFQSVGPYIMDTSPPLFIGASIQVNLSGSFLVANWSTASFIDVDDPYQLRYAYAIGKFVLNQRSSMMTLFSLVIKPVLLFVQNTFDTCVHTYFLHSYYFYFYTSKIYL